VLRDVAEMMPLKHLIDGLSGAMLSGEGLADHVTAVVALGLWAAVGVALAVRGFSWDARRD
jgi:ABC-2 type transport system permease protein